MLTLEFFTLSTDDKGNETFTSVETRCGQHFVPPVGAVVAFCNPDRFFTVVSQRWFYDSVTHKKPTIDIEITPYTRTP